MQTNQLAGDYSDADNNQSRRLDKHKGNFWVLQLWIFFFPRIYVIGDNFVLGFTYYGLLSCLGLKYLWFLVATMAGEWKS